MIELLYLLQKRAEFIITQLLAFENVCKYVYVFMFEYIVMIQAILSVGYFQLFISNYSFPNIFVKRIIQVLQLLHLKRALKR